MNKIFKNIILCIACSIGLIVTGINTVDIKTETELKQSSYTLTDFDYVITSPSKDQITSFRAETDSVKAIFPCYAFDASLSGTSKSKITLLLSDDMDDYSIGLFNDSTKTSGTYNENGLMLDKTAASKLGVTVGDVVFATLANVNFEFTVSSIYMASTYTSLDDGLALAKFSSDISNAYGKELSYDYAFIDAQDSTKCAEMLKSYIPMGSLQSEEAYIAEYKSKNNCPPAMTEAEWDESIKTAYEEYKNTYLSQIFTGVVQNKADYMADVKDQIETTVESINYICVGIAVGIVVLYTLLSIVFINSNRENDIISAKDGTKDLFKPYYLVTVLGTIAVAAVTGLVLYFYVSASQFLTSYTSIILSFSLPVLICILFILPFVNRYEKKLKAELEKTKGNFLK